MASRSVAPGADAEAFAAYAAMAGLDLVATSPPASMASSVEAVPATGVGSFAGPPASGEPEAEAPPSSGEVPGQLPPGWDAVPRRRPLPQAGELSASAWSPPRAPRVRPVCTAVAGTAVRRLRRWLYIARAVIYLFAWAAWFKSFCISPPGLGSRPRPILRDTVSSGPRLEKEGCCAPLVLCSAPARP